MDNKLKFYLVSWVDGGDWDTFDSFVVCAASELEARSYHPNFTCRYDSALQIWIDASGEENKCVSKTWAARPTESNVSVELLTKQPGVILASFNAG